MDYKKEIINRIEKIAGKYSAYEVFTDWIRCCALAISNSVTLIHGKVWKHMKPKEIFKFNFSGVKSFDCQCGRHYINTAGDDGWIPIEERLPEEYEWVLTTLLDKSGKEYYLDIAYLWKDSWHSLTDSKEKVIAWCPLPKPYRKERSNNHDEE